ncbi:MAG: hypothetical protein U0Q47_06705 [Mycobacterium sp.]
MTTTQLAAVTEDRFTDAGGQRQRRDHHAARGGTRLLYERQNYLHELDTAARI